MGTGRGSPGYLYRNNFHFLRRPIADSRRRGRATPRPRVKNAQRCDTGTCRYMCGCQFGRRFPETVRRGEVRTCARRRYRNRRFCAGWTFVVYAETVPPDFLPSSFARLVSRRTRRVRKWQKEASFIWTAPNILTLVFFDYWRSPQSFPIVIYFYIKRGDPYKRFAYQYTDGLLSFDTSGNS